MNMHEDKCNHCKRIMYALNFNTFYRDNIVTITYQGRNSDIYLCLECKRKLDKFISGGKK